MKAAFSITALCFAAACGGAGGAGGNIDSGVDAPSSMVVQSVNAVRSSSDRTFAGMLNNVRAVNGSDPVFVDTHLVAAAQGHAEYIFNLGYLTHYNTDDADLYDPGDRAIAAGYGSRFVGENIGSGYLDEESVLVGWVESPGHQANNIDPRFEDFGLAKAGTGSNQYWVLMLGRD